MATASNALYGVDVYSDSSEDSGNWESAGPRRSGGYRVEVSAGNATEKDRDAASDSGGRGAHHEHAKRANARARGHA